MTEERDLNADAAFSFSFRRTAMNHAFRTSVVFLALSVGASAQSAQRTVEQLERETAGQIAALRGGLDRLDSDYGQSLTDTQWADERERLTSETRTAVNNFIESSIRPSEEVEAIQARLRSVLAAHVPDREDLPTARTADLRFGRSLVVVYTVVRWPHFDSGLISGYKEDAGRFQLQATAGSDFDDYTMSTLEVPSPFKDELWLLAKGQRHTFNGRLIRFRLYGFDGEGFRTIWSPDDMLSATVRTTPEGFAITHEIRQPRSRYMVTEEYTLTLNGVVRIR